MPKPDEQIDRIVGEVLARLGTSADSIESSAESGSRGAVAGRTADRRSGRQRRDVAEAAIGSAARAGFGSGCRHAIRAGFTQRK